MSNQDLVTSFREAAEALEKLPQLQESHAQKEAALTQAQEAIKSLNFINMDLIAKIDSLNDKVRALEVERDDAGFRELETKENLEVLLRTLNSVAGTVSQAVAAHTPKPEVIEPSAAAEVETKVEVTLPHFEEKPLTPETVEVGNPLVDEALAAATPITGSNDGPVDEWTRPAEAPTAIYSKDWSEVHPNDKPKDVSWKDFVAGGGRRPFWVTDEMMALGEAA